MKYQTVTPVFPTVGDGQRVRDSRNKKGAPGLGWRP